MRFDASHAVLRRTGVPDGWLVKKVSDIARIVSGGTPDRNDSANWRDGGVPWITPTDLTANNEKYISKGAEFISDAGLQSSNTRVVPVGSIIFSTRGTVGNLAIAGVPLTTNQSCEVLIPVGDAICGEFLYYLLGYGMFAFHRLAGGTTFGAITRKEIGRVHIALPSCDEQKAISHVLSAIDVTIGSVRKEVRHALTLGSSVIADLLSGGVDDRGKVRDRTRSANEFHRTRLGLIPSTWRLSNIGNEFKLQNGFTLSEARRARLKARRYLRVANVHRDDLRLGDIQELDANDKEFALRVLEVDDLLVVEGHADRMEIGRCARVTKDAAGLTFQNHLFRLRSRGEILPYFGCLWLNSSHAQRYWNASCATSSGLNTINQRMLKRLALPVPPVHEQEKICGMVKAQREHIHALETKLSDLLVLKQSLMHDLLTGQVRVDPALFAA